MKKIILMLLLLNLTSAVVSANNAMEGTMTNPLKGALIITSPYGWRIHPITGVRTFHTGVDLGADFGDPVFAAADGVVTYAGWYGGYGIAVVIEHLDNVQTIYGHNQSVLVHEGQTVTQGQQIAEAGSTGNSTGPHCHFEVRVNGQHDDPAKYLSGLPPSGDSEDDYGDKSDKDFAPINFDAHYDFAKPIRDAIDAFGRACTKGLGIITGPLSWLFFTLITIDMALSATGLILDGFDSSDVALIKWILLKILFYGFLTFMFLHWNDVANTIREYFVSMGALALGKTEADAAKIVSDPTEIIRIGVAYVGPIFAYISSLGPKVLLHLPTVIVCVITAFAILLCFGLLGIEIALAYVEFYCTALFGFVGFTFVACKGTREYAANAVNGLFVSALKLMVFTVIALIISVALHDSVPKDYFDVEKVSSSDNGGNFADVYQFAATIKQVETRGHVDPYNTPSDDGYGYGAYQISYANWDAWCKEAGVDPPPAMPWPPEIQDRVAFHKMQAYYDQYGSWEAVARLWNTGSATGHIGDDYWAKVRNGGGTTVEKTISMVLLLKMFFVAFAVLIFGHDDAKVIMKEFGQKGFRFQQQGIRSMKL